MSKKTALFFFLISFIVLLDQLTKLWIVARFEEGEQLRVLNGFFDLVHYRNKGAAFGMFADWASPKREIFFWGSSVLALSFLAYQWVITSFEKKKILIPVLMIAGGAIGNILDRIFRGSVVDFLLFHWKDKSVSFDLLGKHFDFALIWPAFNVADMSISLGVFFLMIGLWREPNQK